jgi:WD40 repeat protein
VSYFLNRISYVNDYSAGRRANSTKTVHNILKLRQLAEVQEQMLRSKDNFGIPTCAVTHVRYLAIGMSRGSILVFDHFQKLAMSLGNSKESKQRGALTAIDFSPDGDHIISGHDTGHIALWDLLSKTCLKLITEGPPVPIISLRFVRRGPKFSFIAADRDGTVDLYTISKYVFAYSTDKQCLLQGRAGAIYASAVLLANPNHPHLCDRLGLIALSNESVTIIVALEPSVRILFRVPRPAVDIARVGALPFLSWRPLQSRDRDRPSVGCMFTIHLYCRLSLISWRDMLTFRLVGL